MPRFDVIGRACLNDIGMSGYGALLATVRWGFLLDEMKTNAAAMDAFAPS